MCNSSHWNTQQRADSRSQSHRWEFGPVGQNIVSLELPAEAAAVVSAVADMAQLDDRLVVEEQQFGEAGGQLGTDVHLGGHLVESS